MFPSPLENPDPNLPPKGFGSKMYAYMVAPNLPVADSTPTLLKLNGVEYDVLNEFNELALNYSFTPVSAGYYLITVSVGWSSIAVADETRTFIRVNGVNVYNARDNSIANKEIVQLVSVVRYLIPSDVIDIYVWHDNATNVNRDVRARLLTREDTYLCIHRLS